MFVGASRRPGNRDPFLPWWRQVTDELSWLVTNFQAAALRVKMLDDRLDGDANRVEEWRHWYSVAVNALAHHTEQQHMILHSDCVRNFVIHEEAFMAAQRPYQFARSLAREI